MVKEDFTGGGCCCCCCCCYHHFPFGKKLITDSLAPHSVVPGLFPGHLMWYLYLWRTEWQWDTVFSKYFGVSQPPLPNDIKIELYRTVTLLFCVVDVRGCGRYFHSFTPSYSLEWSKSLKWFSLCYIITVVLLLRIFHNILSWVTSHVVFMEQVPSW